MMFPEDKSKQQPLRLVRPKKVQLVERRKALNIPQLLRGDRNTYPDRHHGGSHQRCNSQPVLE